MKRFYFFLLALLTLAVQAATVNVGYKKNDGDLLYAYDGFGQPPADIRMGAAIRITPEMYAPYVGATIKAIRVGWSNPQNSTPCTVFMRKELSGKDNILSGSGTLKFIDAGNGYQGKYVTIPLDNPEGLTLTEDLGTFYVGCYAETVKQKTWAFGASYPAGQAGAAYFWGDFPENYDGEGNEVWEDHNAERSVCIDLVVEGTFTDKVQPISIINYPTMNGDEPDTGLLTIKNWGTNDVSKVTLEYQFGEETKNYTLNLNPTLKAGEQKRLSAPVWAMGDGTHQLRITKAGSKKNNIDTPIEYQTTLVPKEVSDKYTRTSLVELYQSENSYYVPKYYTDLFLPGYEPYAEHLNVIGQHIDDQWELGDEDGTRLMLEMCDNDSSAVSTPAISVDRSASIQLIGMGESSKAPYHNLTTPQFAQYLYEPQLARPTFASINVESTVEGDKVIVTVSGNIADGILAPGKHLHLTATLVEDDVYTDSQQQDEVGKGDYYHKNLQRICLTDKWGDEIPVESGDYSMTFTADLYPEEWNLQNMRVVAFVNRTPADGNMWHRDILNSASCPLTNGGEAGIHSLTTGQTQTTAPIYDLQGRRIDNVANASGVYIVNGKKMVRK